jgi:hypothetical protein
MVTSKRGRLSSADRERIHALAERGMSVDEIASEVERREDVIEAILGKNKAASNGRAKRSRVEEDRSSASNGAGRPRAKPVDALSEMMMSKTRRVGGTLEHMLWVRPGFQIQLTLPADLSQTEAERLSVMVRNLPFSMR